MENYNTEKYMAELLEYQKKSTNEISIPKSCCSKKRPDKINANEIKELPLFSKIAIIINN